MCDLFSSYNRPKILREERIFGIISDPEVIIDGLVLYISSCGTTLKTLVPIGEMKDFMRHLEVKSIKELDKLPVDVCLEEFDNNAKIWEITQHRFVIKSLRELKDYKFSIPCMEA
jgi:hypothetical protein